MQAQLESGPPVQLPEVTPKSPLRSPARHFAKLKSTLHQFVRDWSEEVRPALPISAEERVIRSD